MFCVLLAAHPASCQDPGAFLWDALNLPLWNSDLFVSGTAFRKLLNLLTLEAL